MAESCGRIGLAAAAREGSLPTVLGVVLAQGSAEAILVASGTVDLVITLPVRQHLLLLARLRTALAEMRCVLVLGGSMIGPGAPSSRLTES